jgi:hypothetical protein
MLTVGLPVYNQTGVLHIALESLCRQFGKWELIVSSEDNIWGVVDSYKDRLKQAGCVNIIYDKLKDWIPLPQKWQRIAQLMSGESLGMMLQAADCYSHPDRIKQSEEAMLQGYNWYNESIGYFYYVQKDLLAIYDNSPFTHFTHLNMCIATKYAKDLPFCDKRAGIDGWMLSCIPENERKVCQVDRLHSGVDLHGLNNISKKRGAMIEGFAKAFKPTKLTIEQIGLPVEVVNQIKQLCM